MVERLCHKYCQRKKMLSVTKDSLPIYLQQSQFAQGWVDSNEMVFIDASVLKMDDSVSNSLHLVHVLESLRFWIVDSLPMSVVAFVLSNSSADIVATLQLYEETLPFVSQLLKVLLVSREDRWATSLRCDCLECTTYFYEHGMYFDWGYSCSMAARAGSLRCLQYLHSQGFPWDDETCEYAAMGGHLECLKYLHQHGCPWDESTTFAGAVAGHTKCLAFALENKCPCDYRAAEFSARNGHKNTLHLLRNYVMCTSHEWNLVMAAAAEHGHLDCLRYLLNDGCEIVNVLVPMMASKEGHLDCLQYYHEAGFSWCCAVTYMAASYGHFHCLEYAIEHGCAWDATVYEDATSEKIREYLVGLNGHNFVNEASDFN